MKVLVTGGTGFIGGNLVRELIYQGYEVKALVRSGSNPGNLRGLELETVTGDLLDSQSLEDAMAGCSALFHVAAMYTFWSADGGKKTFESNVTGTKNILRSAAKKKLEKVVHTSSESTIGIEGSGPGTEEKTTEESRLSGAYKKSKLLAERVALEFSRELPVVVVNPTMPVGPYDIKPTPTGQIIVDFLNRRMPAFVDTGMNLIGVNDVAKGHILALEKGVPGERYILGNRNLEFRNILELLAQITETKCPKFKMPFPVALSIAYVDEFISGRVLRKYPRIPVASVKAARSVRHFDCSKAVRELGLPQSPVEDALREAVVWFRENGYVKE